MAFDRIYTDELDRLRNLGREFSEENPAIAPFLSSASGDPDIERLLQGFAFLSAMVRQKMDDELPEFIHDVAALVGPELTKPMPAITVLKLDLIGKIENGYPVPEQTPFASMQVEGTVCQFATAWPVTIQPVILTSVHLEPFSQGTHLRLKFKTQGLSLVQWRGRSLTLFLSGAVVEACGWLLGMRHKLLSCTVKAEEEDARSYPLTLRFPGLDPTLSLFPVDRSIAGHIRWVREFLAFPERAFFVVLEGFQGWEKSVVAEGFTIDFEFNMAPQELPKPGLGQFTVNTVPAANIFETYADPIEITHLKESYKIIPSDLSNRHAEVHDVISVRGRRQGESVDRVYAPFTEFLTDSNIGKYQIVFNQGTRFGLLEHFIRLPFSGVPDLDHLETLSIRLRCTNGRLPEKLKLGDVSKRTVDSPERLTVTNVTMPTSSTRPSLGVDSMWKVVAHARLNLQAFSSVEILKETLSLYAPDGGEPARLAAIKRRIQGLEQLEVKRVTRMQRGTLLRGHEIFLRMNRDFFAGPGDLMLFGELLAHFFAGLVPLNTFASLTVIDSISGEEFKWPALLAPGLRL